MKSKDEQSAHTQRPVEAIVRKLFIGLSVFALGLTIVSCSSISRSTLATEASPGAVAVNESIDQVDDLATATFAGGCFWCMEQPFDDIPGVASTVSGYTGGQVENPTYTQVSSGSTGHLEAMQVTYHPDQVSYLALLETFWHNIDPLDDRGQFCDKGTQYRSAIFYETAEQQEVAQATKQEVAEQLDASVATDILPATTFYPAEDYHQNYYQTHPVRYKVYRFGCGRDQRLSEVWGDDAPAHDSKL
ncbi:Peptide methionine sulfoxide reductase family [Synechococcus sp. PCC 7335]|uniref:peptide-methionine (S)-S-oxide reductase MsrA n=1 Tax=Synechococcus sp. (strain ATCC 29403 / PCC 7335) TaxID=91464 RepID=UPI00017EE753|nr:peptide-methionine (S)-S-oxide reductase MsrA [Synechococcus sp. PCC 7335]EDX86819.1 Peptide methionine sulfoxide reductase family [Synechococcus sp. PCC 7335]